MSAIAPSPNIFLKSWNTYKFFVQKQTCYKDLSMLDNIDGWRHRLFTNFIMYVLPSCIIALIPGVYMSLKNGYIFIAVSDLLTVGLIAFVSLSSLFSLQFKKVFVVAILYLLSTILIIYLSLLGPGIVYLLSLSVVIAITCKTKWAYSTVGINLLICLACALIIHFRLFNAKINQDYSLGVWIAVSSNLVFLSTVIVLLVNKAILVCENTILKESILKEEVHQKNIEQLESNALLKESEEHYKSMFIQNPSPMWILDKKSYNFLQVNEAAIKCYGYSNEEFLSLNIMDIKVDSEKGSITQYLNDDEKMGNPLTLVTQHKRKNKEAFYVEVTINTIPFLGKQSALGISNDITEQMNYLKSIQLQNEKLKEIAWIQCHKVRAPLASILGLISLIKEDNASDDKTEIIQGIYDSAAQLDKVITETVTTSRPLDGL